MSRCLAAPDLKITDYSNSAELRNDAVGERTELRRSRASGKSAMS